MFELKNWIEKNNVKNVAISRFYRNAGTNLAAAKNASSLDIVYTKKFLIEECNIHPEIIKSKDNVDFSKYDLIIFQPYSFIMFGGIWESHNVDYIYKYARDFNGVTMCIYNDPNISWTNPLSILEAKNRVLRNKEIVSDDFDKNLIEKFQTKNLVGMFVGKDFDKFKKLAKKRKFAIWPNDIIKVKLGEYIHSHVLKECENSTFNFDIEEREFDVIYYGSNRGGGRAKELKRLFKNNSSLRLKWVGYDPKFPNVSWEKKIRYDKLCDVVRKSLTSIVVGDNAHNDNIVLYRFYEAMKFNVINLISTSFDPKKELIKNAELQKICYINSLSDIEESCKKLRSSKLFYNDMLKAQAEEIKNLTEKWHVQNNE